MNMLNIAGYKFIGLCDLDHLRTKLLNCLNEIGDIRGTILLSQEGININLAGPCQHIKTFLTRLATFSGFADIKFHQTFSETIPFRFLKVKIKKEIITLRQPEINAVKQRAACLSPAELKQWIDEEQDFVLLDTRNEFEVKMGTFKGAVDLKLNDFGEFPQKAATLQRDKPIVMFCTGGIRCEKAALYLQNQGYDQVYQLDGGILGYFAQVGQAHYEGTCFVFDARETVSPN